MKLDPTAQAELANLALEIANTPETRRDYANLVRKVHPERRFFDIEADEAKEAIHKEFEKRDQESRQRQALQAMEQERAKVAERYDANAMKEIESLMQEHGLASYQVAARLYAAETKLATPTSSLDDHRFSMPKFDMKDLSNLNSIARAKAMATLDEIRRN
jgi:hypothetical protein